MHIPDGYLSPQTWVPAYGAMIPLWSLASKKLKKTLRARQMPMLALGAAFSFIVMMFNIPTPFGTTGHMVGAVLVAILLGPWAAMMAISLALIVQALVFGDGGITTIAANCLNMAVVMPFVGWGVYRLVAGAAPAESRRHKVAAAAGGYVGLNAAALTTAFMFGIQPLISRGADGRPLYCPFGLNVAVPVMAAEHLLLFGFVEAAVTGMVIAYIQRTDPSLIPTRSLAAAARVNSEHRSVARKAALVLLLLALISPLGLYLPARYGAGSAWGEWSAEEIGKIAGYVPHQLAKTGSIWRAPMPDYALHGQESASLSVLGLGYVLSALVGIASIALVILLLRRLLIGRKTDEFAAGVDASKSKL